MKNIVSFETAKRLKEAGFVQPEPEVGQFWYNPDFGLFLVGRRWYVDGIYRNIFYIESGKAFEKGENDFSECIFAPTATDILEKLPDFFYIRKVTNEKAIFTVFDEGGPFSLPMLVSKWVHNNPDEAASAAWLDLNEKK